jgi:hypothetical protein
MAERVTYSTDDLHIEGFRLFMELRARAQREDEAAALEADLRREIAARDLRIAELEKKLEAVESKPSRKKR